FKRHGMIIEDVERRPIHGGSLRLFVSKAARPDHSQAVRALLSDEASWGLSRLDYYQDFARRVERLKHSLRALLTTLKREGNRMAAYGAPAKGNTLLNYCGVRTDLLDYTVDRSPHKQNTFLPGTHIPVHAPARIDEVKPDYVLILPWNIQEEIVKQMAHIRSWGGKFVVPIPKVRVLD
ncbi:MAG: methyltransferase C-terminal domain-containing protein, partial [Terriglobales bacterium]